MDSNVLDLYDQGLNTVPDAICDRVELDTLLVANNRLTALPGCLARLTNLRTLDAGHNQIVEVPELPEITDFLYLHDNRISALPASFFKPLRRLKYLNLGDNPLQRLPDEIGSMESLEELRLENSGLTSIPDAIGRLGALVELALRNNALTTLPESMRALARLTNLDLRGNRFTTLPGFVGELPRLAKLDLRWNRLLTLPPWIDGLRERGCRVLF